MNDLPFKKSWAGQDDDIQRAKPSWSVGNFEFIPREHNQFIHHDTTKPTNNPKSIESISPSHKWLMLHLFLKMFNK